MPSAKDDYCERTEFSSNLRHRCGPLKRRRLLRALGRCSSVRYACTISYGRPTRSVDLSIGLSIGRALSRRMRPANPKRPIRPASPHSPELSSSLMSGAVVWGDCAGGVPGACAAAIGRAVTVIIAARSNTNAGIVRVKARDFIETPSITL